LIFHVPGLGVGLTGSTARICWTQIKKDTGSPLREPLDVRRIPATAPWVDKPRCPYLLDAFQQGTDSPLREPLDVRRLAAPWG